MDDAPPSSHFSRPKGVGLLWAGLLAAPVAWALNLSASYAMVGWLCERGQGGLLLHVVTALSLGVAAVGFLISWRNWRVAGPSRPEEGPRAARRGWFMAVSGLILSGFFALAIVAQWIPVLLLDPCVR